MYLFFTRSHGNDITVFMKYFCKIEHFFILQNALKDFSDDIVVETDISVALETEEYPCDLHYLEDQIRWNGEDIMSGNVQYTLNP